MQVFVLGVLLLVCFVCADPQVSVGRATVVKPGYYRSYTAVASPSAAAPNGWAFQSVGLTGERNSTNGDGHIDVATLSFVNPAANDKQLGFYYGFFSANAQWNQQAGITHGSASAALAEVAAVFTDILVYYERNGQPGFQYQLGDAVWDCTTPSTQFDCVDTSKTISLQSLTWSTITATTMDCPTGGNYVADCKVYLYTTTGSANGSAIATFVFKFASQAVQVDGVDIPSDYGKIDVTISYPWPATGLATARIALVAVSAGKAAAAGVIGVVGGKSAAVYSAGTVASAYFSWDGSAQIGGSDSTVYATGLSGDTIKNYQCNTAATPVFCVLEALVVTGWKVLVGVYEALGWKVEFVVFSWAVDHPTTISWDPAVAVENPNAVDTSSAPALGSFLVGAILVQLFALLF